jgi:hypothetical protein
MQKKRKEIDIDSTFGSMSEVAVKKVAIELGTEEPLIQTENRKYRPASKMTKEEFATACVLWESGDFSAEILSEQFLVYQKSLEGRFLQAGSKRSNVEKFKPEANLKEKAKEIMQFDGFDAAIKIGETRKRTYSLYQAAENQAASIISQAVKEGSSIAKYKEDFKALKDFVSVVQMTSEGKMKLLGVTSDYNFSDENSLPILTIAKMTDAEIENAINSTEMNDFDFSVIETMQEIDQIIEEGDVSVEKNE